MKKYYREVALGNWGEGSSLLVLKRLTLLPVKNRAGSGLLSTPVEKKTFKGPSLELKNVILVLLDRL